MRIVIRLMLPVVLAVGCSAKRPPPTPAYSEPGNWTGSTAQKQPPKLIVTPASGAAGKVAMVNITARFVVLNYPLGHLPPTQQRLNLYRRGLKVGEIKITGPQYDDNIVADLVAGECEVGDEARE